MKPASPTGGSIPIEHQTIDDDRVSYKSGHKSRAVSRGGSATSKGSGRGGLR